MLDPEAEDHFGESRSMKTLQYARGLVGSLTICSNGYRAVGLDTEPLDHGPGYVDLTLCVLWRC